MHHFRGVFIFFISRVLALSRVKSALPFRENLYYLEAEIFSMLSPHSLPFLRLLTLAMMIHWGLGSGTLLQSQSPSPHLLEKLLTQSAIFRDSIAPRAELFELQAILKVYRPDGRVEQYSYGLDTGRYFYPASTVKLPVVQLALQRICEWGNANDAILCLQDADSLKCRKLADDVLDILVLSDNEAFNRLFDWLGPQYINATLQDRGIRTRIRHRLGRPAEALSNDSIALPLSFLLHAHSGDTLMKNPARKESLPASFSHLEGQLKGRGFYTGKGELREQAFDFSGRNYLGLEDLLRLIEDIHPNATGNDPLFHLCESGMQLLREGATKPPRLSAIEAHRGHEDGYVKFLYHGGSGMIQPGDPSISNKVGIAYGSMTDAALFFSAEDETVPRFALALTMLVNLDGVFNDDAYEYESIGFPFFKELGRLAWEELGE